MGNRLAAGSTKPCFASFGVFVFFDKANDEFVGGVKVFFEQKISAFS
jgi:hypothetical protein